MAGYFDCSFEPAASGVPALVSASRRRKRPDPTASALRRDLCAFGLMLHFGNQIGLAEYAGEQDAVNAM
jgi:hypothetical protein